MINNEQEKKDSLLPPPEIIARYQELGIGEDLIKLVENEQNHRHLLQNKYLLNYRLGQLLSFIVSLSAIYGIFELIKLNKNKEAYIVLSVLVFIVTFVMYMLRSNRKINMIRKNNNTIRNNRQQNNRRNINQRYK